MKIVVTGANGFLGRHLMSKLQAMGYDPYDPYPVYSKNYDLRQPWVINALLEHLGSIDILYHLAANVGGLSHNLNNPASIYADNVLMNTQLIHLAAQAGVGKFIFAGSVCSYPENPPIPTKESDLWRGYPEASNGAYGISKLMALTQLEACRQQFGLNYAYPVLANLYGPGDGGFFDDKKAHVVPALIKRFMTFRDEATVWGDGSPTRDFLYVDDAVEALVRFLEVDYHEPVNIALGEEVSIERLVDTICDQAGYTGTVIWDYTKPMGQLRRCYDVSRANKVLGLWAKVGIEEGIKNTVEWYQEWTNSKQS